MPALPNVASCLRVALGFTLSPSTPALSRFYFQYGGTAPTVGQLSTFNASIATAFTSDLKALCGTGCELTQIETTDLTSPTGAQAVTAEAITGTRTGATNSNDLCFVTSYEINRRYRGGHPRGYWPFGTASDIAAGNKTWAGATVTAVNTGMASFMAAIAAAGWTGAGTLQQVNVSYYKGFTVVTSPTTGRARNVPTLRATPVQDVVQSIATKSSIGVQRRRLEFVD